MRCTTAAFWKKQTHDGLQSGFTPQGPLPPDMLALQLHTKLANPLIPILRMRISSMCVSEPCKTAVEDIDTLLPVPLCNQNSCQLTRCLASAHLEF